MEFFFVLVALFFLVGPIILFFMVIGARSRVATLERNIGQLQDEMKRLRQQVALMPSTEMAAPPVVKPEQAGHNAYLLTNEARIVVATAQEAAARPEKPLCHEIPKQTDPGSIPLPYDKITAPKSAAQAKKRTEYKPASPPAWVSQARKWLFGGNLVAKAGLLILFFGVSFLLKYAAARVSVPIELRLAAITLADIGLLLWGWRIRVSRSAISLPVQGCALGIMMLVTFGAYRMYDLIPGSLAFGLLFALTFFTCILAVLQNAIWLAIFGIVGGFAAPILTSTGHGSHIALFSYYALLNTGILVIALKRSWRLLNLLGFVFTFLIGAAWGVLRYQPENYLSVQCFLILFFVFYVALAILYAHRQAPQLKNYVDGVLVFGTPLLSFGLQYGIVHDKHLGAAFSALALGIFYIALTWRLWQKRGSSLKLLVESFLALGIVFGTLAIPFALDGRWTSAAWALEGAGVVWVGLRQKQTLAWLFGLLVQAGAWFSFIASVSGLDHTVAVQSNLWLGFLLLAGTGFIMAMRFRKETQSVGEEAPRPAFMFLATVFLGCAALWLLAGAWTEIFLRGGAHTHTLLVLSAMGVAGILGLIANRLDWNISRDFTLVPQVLAGLIFLKFVNFDQVLAIQANGDNLFNTAFTGSLLIALGAGFTSLAFLRQADGRHRQLSRILLGWCGFWWFVYVLGSFSSWGEHILASHNLFSETAYPRAHPLYSLLLALGAPAFVRMSKRLQWRDLRWMAYAIWPGLLFSMLNILMQLDNYPSSIPPWPVWAALVALWLVSEWLLGEGRRDAWLLPEQRPIVLRALHTLRSVGPWLILWPLGEHLVRLGLQIDSPQQAVLLAEAGWTTSGSWARYLPAWAMMAYIAFLLPRARAADWPTAPIPGWYRNVLIPLGALWSLTLVVIWNFTQNGLMEPLPYLPILNPLDLSTGFAALLSAHTCRLLVEKSNVKLPARLPLFAAITAYVWFNLMLLRTAAHFLAIPYQLEPLFQSNFVQAVLSLVWSATALVLMRFAAQRLLRTPWLTGAGLLVLVVAKLFFVDLSNVGGIERIVSFLGVGVLMLAIGYLSPFPTEKPMTKE